MSSRASRIAFAAALFGTALSLSACGDREAGEATQGAAVLSPAELRKKLAAADEFDGTKDRVISLCAGCRLGMSGQAQHAVSAEGYTLHMCSQACKAHFEEDLNAAMAELEIPKS